MSDIRKTYCAFIPIFCHYDRSQGGEVKTPILFQCQSTSLLSLILLELDISVLNQDELTDEFVQAYRERIEPTNPDKSLDAYDIYPQLVSILHADEEDITVYVCELYENSEPYFKKASRSNVGNPLTYKDCIDHLIQQGNIDELSKSILVSLSEERFITSTQGVGKSIELFG